MCCFSSRLTRASRLMTVWRSALLSSLTSMRSSLFEMATIHSLSENSCSAWWAWSGSGGYRSGGGIGHYLCVVDSVGEHTARGHGLRDRLVQGLVRHRLLGEDHLVHGAEPRAVQDVGGRALPDLVPHVLRALDDARHLGHGLDGIRHELQQAPPRGLADLGRRAAVVRTDRAAGDGGVAAAPAVSRRGSALRARDALQGLASQVVDLAERAGHVTAPGRSWPRGRSAWPCRVASRAPAARSSALGTRGPSASRCRGDWPTESGAATRTGTARVSARR